ncbi:putative ABC transporter permease [Candidatus Saccharibacteria bacterium]|nr:putative ABC transporter permease [Candidatus Saccharibacteria bacterium]
MEKVIPFIIYFFIYSFIGYVIEVIYCSIMERKIVSRGFLFGPILPVYGFGMLAVIVATEPVKTDLILTFLVSMLLCSTIEYFTSWLLEKLFGIKWWDYSDETKYNLNGRICLHSSLLFGILGCLIVKQVQPKVAMLVSLIGKYQPAVAVVLLVLVLLDTMVSIFIVSKVKRSLLLKFRRGDQTDEIKRLARKTVVRIITGKDAAKRKIKKAKKVVKKKQQEIGDKIKVLNK